MSTFMFDGSLLGTDASGNPQFLFYPATVNVVVGDGGTLEYDYQQPFDPELTQNVFGIPGADFGDPATNQVQTTISVFGQPDVQPDEVYVYNLVLPDGVATVLELYIESTDQTVIVVLDYSGTGSPPVIASQADLDALLAANPTGQQIGSGPWAPNTPLDPSTAISLFDQTEDDIFNGEDIGETFEGGLGNDQLNGNGGNDSLGGGDGNDTLSGGDGDDTLIDGAGDDSIFGGAGNDVIYNTSGSDTYDGGDGFDTFFVDLSSFAPGAFVLEVNFVTGYSGRPGNPILSDTISNFEALDVIGALDVTATGDANANWVRTGSGNDTIDGGAGDDTLLGGAGDDIISAGDGNNSVDGGAGNDQLILDGNQADYTIDLLGTAGTISGGGETIVFGGIEELVFNDGTVNLSGGTPTSGDDTLVGEVDADTLSGGAGNDTILGGGGDDSLNGGIGFDSVQGGTGDDTLRGLDGFDVLEGGDGNDQLAGNNGNDTLSGDGGNDTLNGGLGADALYGGADDDDLSGLQGFDLLDGGDGSDLVNGNAGNDTLLGGEGNDTLLGGIGFDSLEGGNGDDRLDGLDGFDTLLGEAGTDTLNGNAGNDSLSGGAGNDTLDGGIGADTLSGGDDDDLLQGAQGFDLIFGDGGDDRLFGNAGNDTLNGGDGNDTMNGGLGADDFVFVSGADQISDFQNNVDELYLVAGLWNGNLTVDEIWQQFGSEVGGNLVLDFGNGNVLTIQGLDNHQQLLDDIVIV